MIELEKNEENKMNKKSRWLFCILILALLIPIVVVISYYYICNRETSEPKATDKICDIETKNFEDRKVFIIKPKEQETDLTILYFHGGSYIAEATEYHWEFLQKLSKDLNATVIMPDYPLTPKYNYKDVFKFLEPLYNKIMEKKDVNNLIMMGDSAGGGMLLALEEKLSQEEIEIPKKTILISPWLDVRLENPKIIEFQNKDKQLNKETLILAGLAYSNGEDNYLVNPIDGDLSKLKNITIFIGTNDILNPDIYLLQEKAKEQGIEIKVKEYENAAHIWMIEKNSGEELTNKGYLDILEEVKNK